MVVWITDGHLSMIIALGFVNERRPSGPPDNIFSLLPPPETMKKTHQIVHNRCL
jgi:hypothetical protein